MPAFSHGVHAFRETLVGYEIINKIIGFGNDAIRYVATTGNDANDGLTVATAFLTIGRGLQDCPQNCANFFLLVLAGTYTESVVIESKPSGRIHIIGQPILAKGTWAVTETVAAYTQAPAGENVGRHQIQITNTGAWAIAAGDVGKFLVFNFADGGNPGPYEVATILERIDNQNCLIGGRGAGAGFPTGRNAASYAGIALVMMEPGTIVAPGGAGTDPVLTICSPTSAIYDANYTTDYYTVGLAWLRINGAAGHLIGILSEVPIGMDCVRIVGAVTYGLLEAFGRCTWGNYYSSVRPQFSLTAAINTAVQTHEQNAATTGSAMSHISGVFQAGQVRKAGAVLDSTQSIRAVFRGDVNVEGLLTSNDVYAGPNSSIISGNVLQCAGTMTIESCSNSQIGRTYIQDGLVVSGASKFDTGNSPCEVECGAAAQAAIVIEEGSDVHFGANLVVDQNVAGQGCISVNDASKLLVDGTLTLDQGAVLARAVYIRNASHMWVRSTTSAAAVLGPQNPLIECDERSSALFVGAIEGPAMNGNFGAGGIIEAHGNSSIEIGAKPSTAFDNTNAGGYGFLMRTGGSIIVPTAYSGVGNRFTGNAGANHMDLGGAGATAYAPGCQTDIGAGVPEMCSKLER